MASAKAPKLQECLLGASEIMRPAAGETAKMAIALNRTAPVPPMSFVESTLLQWVDSSV